MTTQPFRLVACGFGSAPKTTYDYKIPADWSPVIGQQMIVSGRGGKPATVTIMEMDTTYVGGVDYKWGLELLPVERADFDGNIATSIPRGGLTGHALAADMRSPESETWREIHAKLEPKAETFADPMPRDEPPESF